MKRWYRISVSLFLVVAAAGCSKVAAPEQQQVQPEQSRQRYTFSRSYLPGGPQAPRGGTTQGSPVTLDEQPSAAWKLLQEEQIDKFERDRRAILAMAGDYRATFEFIETIPLKAGVELDRPYQSWATERVYVLADNGDFISLQHIMVMFFVREGKTEGPVVIKHWRQDWTYEPEAFHEFEGEKRWALQMVLPDARTGAWLQEVFHVDDSPRYASVGRWAHAEGFSVWTGGETFRPLPRREYSVRSDYDVLEAINRHVILPSGWVHEQENLKRVLRNGRPTEYVSREIGLNRYERIKGFPFEAGDAYWQETRAYWDAVRAVWEDIFHEKASFIVLPAIEGTSLIEKQFATALQQRRKSSAESLYQTAADLIAPHVQ